MQVNRDVCIGMLLAGVLHLHDHDDIKNNKYLSEIAHKLDKKLFDFRNGDSKFRKNAKRIYKKRKDPVLINKVRKMEEQYKQHLILSNNAYNLAQSKMDAVPVTVTDVIYLLLTRNKSAQLFYEFSDNFLEDFKNSSAEKGKYIFRSLKVVNVISECLDIEIATFNYN